MIKVILKYEFQPGLPTYVMMMMMSAVFSMVFVHNCAMLLLYYVNRPKVSGTTVKTSF